MKNSTQKFSKCCFSFFILLIIPLYSLNAQDYEYVPFPTKNTVWTNYAQNPGLPYPYENMLHIIACFDEDTILYNWTWQKVYQLYDSIPDKDKATVRGYITEQEKIVYFIYTEGYGGILYNFNATIGDTVITDFDFSHSPLIVSQIDTLLIGNKKRKRIKFTRGEDFDDLSWIEGIGSTNGLLKSGSFVIGTHSTLLCVKEENETVYYNDMFGTCYPDYPTHYNKINEVKETEKLTIYPNPATETITIEFPENTTGTLNIIRLDGRIILTENISINYQQDISVAHFKNGVYIIKFIGCTGNYIYRNYLIINK